MREVVVFRTRHLETDQEIRLVLYDTGDIEAFVDDEPYESKTFEYLQANIESGKEWLELWQRETITKSF